MDDLELGYTPRNLRVLIDKSGQTRAAVADKLGVSLRTVNNWLIADLNNDQHRDMPLQMWRKFLENFHQTR